MGTCEGVAEAGHRLDGALTVAHAVWHFAGVSLVGRPKERALTRSLCDLTRFAKWARVGAECQRRLSASGGGAAVVERAQRLRFVGWDGDF